MIILRSGVFSLKYDISLYRKKIHNVSGEVIDQFENLAHCFHKESGNKFIGKWLMWSPFL